MVPPATLFLPAKLREVILQCANFMFFVIEFMYIYIV